MLPKEAYVNQLTAPLLLLVVVVPLLAFWAWMFREMMNNDYLSPSAKNFWMMAFLVFNVLAAIYYYSTVYRNGP